MGLQAAVNSITRGLIKVKGLTFKLVLSITLSSCGQIKSIKDLFHRETSPIAPPGSSSGLPASQSLKTLAIYYGWPSSLNSSQNQWNLDLVANELSNYNYVILGAGLEEDIHSDHNNTKTIIAKAKNLNPTVKFLGYVTISPSGDSTAISLKVQQWKNMGIDGLFLDEMGFDFLVNQHGLNESAARERQNAWLSAVHNQELFAMMNAWDPDDLFFKVDSLPLSANSEDFYLFESFFQSSQPIQVFSEFLDKMNKARRGQERYGVKFAAINTRANGDNFSSDHWLTLQLAAHFFGISAVGWGYPDFSAGSASMPYFSIHDSLKSLVPSSRDVNVENRQMIMSFGERTCTITYGASAATRGNDITFSCSPAL